MIPSGEGSGAWRPGPDADVEKYYTEHASEFDVPPAAEPMRHAAPAPEPA